MVKASTTTFALLAAALTACTAPQSGPTPVKMQNYTVTAYRTPFYRYGPAQGTGADFLLLKGQNVMLLKRSFGYSQVLTADGMSGYVSTDDIGPAPAPAPTPTPPAHSRRSTRTGEEKPGVWMDPVYSDPPLGLPTRDNPVPGFRY